MSNQRVTFHVDGMTCGVCSLTVEAVLEKSPGVVEASVSCVTHLGFVTFDPSLTSVACLIDEIEAVGFDATLVEEVSPVEKAKRNSSIFSVTIQIGGMTCTACAGTVERHLLGLKGVERVSVSLVLNKAFVTCDSSIISVEMLKDEVENVGFDAEVLASGPEGSVTSSSTIFHFRLESLTTAPPRRGHIARSRTNLKDVSARMNDLVHEIQGVVSIQPVADSWRVAYDPRQVGARHVLARLQDEFVPHYSVEWTKVAVEYEHVEALVREMKNFRYTLLFATPITATVIFIALILPHTGLGELWGLDYRIHHGVDLKIALIFLLCTPVQLLLARRFHVAAWKALRRKSANMDVLVSVSTNTSYIYSTFLVLYCFLMPRSPSSGDLIKATTHFYSMGPILITIVLFGKFLESSAKLSATRALTDLPSSIPSVATLCSSGGNEDKTIPVDLIELDDILQIFPGGKIPVDGRVCSDGTLYVDESLLTGESVPKCKINGDVLIGGSTCVTGGCLLRVTSVGGDTMLGQIVTLVHDAQASKANVQRVADRVAQVFVPSVVFLSFLTVLIWIALVFTDVVQMPKLHHHGPQALSDIDSSVENSLKLLFAMKFGISVLMVACPCAMGLATPMAVMVASGVSARLGCLSKSAAAFEIAANLDVIVLDKTGTITKGMPTVKGIAMVSGNIQNLAGAWKMIPRTDRSGVQSTCANSSRNCPTTRIFGQSEALQEVTDCFLWLLGTLESTSDHPVAKCILDHIKEFDHLPQITAPSDFDYMSGRGVRCKLESMGGKEFRIGNMRFYEEASAGCTRTPEENELLLWVSVMQASSHTVIIMHADAKLLGAVALQDPVREDAAWVIKYMRDQLGLEIWMCTGDNAATAQSIAAEVGIKHVIAEALPSTKSECVQQLQKGSDSRYRRKVGFVGDGINDSIALAQADVGMAIGVGTQVAVEAADVALVRSELVDCINFLALSRATLSTIRLNLFWAFCFNFICLPMAAGLFYPKIHIPPLVAGIGMASSSCLVVFTSLSLRRFLPPSVIAERGSASVETVGLMSDSASSSQVQYVANTGRRCFPVPRLFGYPLADEDSEKSSVSVSTPSPPSGSSEVDCNQRNP